MIESTVIPDKLKSKKIHQHEFKTYVVLVCLPRNFTFNDMGRVGVGGQRLKSFKPQPSLLIVKII